MKEETKVLCELVHKNLEEYGMYHCQSGGYMEQLEKEVDGVMVLVVISGPYALGRARMDREERCAWDQDMWVAMQACMRDTTVRGAQNIILMFRRAVRWRPPLNMERHLTADLEFERNFPELAQERGSGTHHPTDELLLEVQTYLENDLHTSNLLNCYVPHSHEFQFYARAGWHPLPCPASGTSTRPQSSAAPAGRGHVARRSRPEGRAPQPVLVVAQRAVPASGAVRGAPVELRRRRQHRPQR